MNIMLTTARAALSVGHSGVGTWDERAGDFATYSGRVLDKGTVELVQK